MKKGKGILFSYLKYVPELTTVLFFILFFCISLSRYFSFQIFEYDFGIFAEIIWRLSQFSNPVINHISLGPINFLGDHFGPSLVILSPLFWIFKDLKILIVEQALVTALAGYLIFRIGVKHGLSHFSSFIIQVLFLIFAGVENPLVTDWHVEPTAGLFLLLFYYLFVFKKKGLLYLVPLIIFLGFKESNAISLVFLLIPVFVTFSEKRKQIISIAIGAVAYFFLTTKVLIPHFSDRPYFYTPKLPMNIKDLADSLSGDKYLFVKQSFLSFLFIPAVSLIWLVPIFGEIAIRVVPTSSFFQNFTLSAHYNVYLGIFLALATIQGVLNLSKLKQFKKYQHLFLVLVLLASLLIAKKFINPPILLAVNPVFWKELKPRTDLFDEIKLVPRKGTIASQNNLLPYLLFRKEQIYPFSRYYLGVLPDTIVFDLIEGDSPNNYFPESRDFYVKQRDLLLKNKEYKRISTKNPQFYIFEKVK